MVRRSARPQPIMKYTLPVAAALALPLAAWTGAGTGAKAGLPEFKAAWASTVHKSQGSEFDSVLLILPADAQSEVLSRELLYTAITRARRQFLLQAPAGVVTGAADRLTRRHSGLAQKLGWPDDDLITA